MNRINLVALCGRTDVLKVDRQPHPALLGDDMVGVCNDSGASTSPSLILVGEATLVVATMPTCNWHCQHTGKPPQLASQMASASPTTYLYVGAMVLSSSSG